MYTGISNDLVEVEVNFANFLRALTCRVTERPVLAGYRTHGTCPCGLPTASSLFRTVPIGQFVSTTITATEKLALHRNTYFCCKLANTTDSDLPCKFAKVANYSINFSNIKRNCSEIPNRLLCTKQSILPNLCNFCTGCVTKINLDAK